MTAKYTLRAALLASTCLLPLAAHAQEEFGVGEVAPVQKAPEYNNEATLGVRYQNSDSALYGRYNGTPYRGFGAIGGFDLNSSDAWDSGKTQYFRAEGDGLIVDRHQLAPNASVSVKYGYQGQWGLHAYYEGIPYWQSLAFHSLNDSSGRLKLPAGSLPVNSGVAFTPLTADPVTGAVISPGATPGDLAAGRAALNGIFATINAFNTPHVVGTQRDIVGGSATYSAFPNWTFSAGLQHEHKQGTKENSFATNDMNNINSFPEPVNWDTDEYTATAQYNAKRLQAVFDYTFSKFNDNITSFTTLNPFNLSDPSLALAPGYTATIYSLPPSNSAHQINGRVAYNLTPTTRLNASLGYELMRQNSPNTLAYAGAPANPYLPPNNYSATVQQMFGNVTLTARPWPKSDFRASYTIDDRKNNSSRVFIPNDTGPTGQITADTLMSTHVPVANLPVSQLNQTVRLEGGYRIIPSTKLSAYYIYSDKQRDFSVTDRNHENTLGAKVNSSLSNAITASLGYTHSVRTAAAYFENSAWLANTFPLTNPSGLGMFYLAARTRDEAKGNITWAVGDKLSGGLTAKFRNDHYPNSFYGVTNDHTLSAGPDLAYSPTKAFTAHLFYAFEELFIDQKFTNNQDPAHMGQSTSWTLGNKDTIHTLGASADWQISDNLKISLADNLSYGATAFNEGAVLISSPGVVQPAFPQNLVGALPDAKTITNAVSLTGEYKLLDNVSLLGSYSFARAIAKDYLYGQTAANFGQPFGTNSTSGDSVQSLGGDGNPSYAVHVIAASVRMKW